MREIRRETKKARVAALKDHPLWARQGKVDQAYIVGLSGSINASGQMVPLILCGDVIIDGHCRVRAMRHAGIIEADAVVLDFEPTPDEVLQIQAELDIHRKNLSAMQRSNLWSSLQKATGCTVTELAERLKVSQPLVSKLLSFQRLCPDIQKLLESGQLDMEKASIIASQTTDPDQQKALLTQAGTLSRNELRQKAKGNGKADVKAPSARFIMPGGMVVAVQGKDMTLTTAIEVLQETVRQLKKAQGQGLDVSTAMRVFRDTAKAAAAAS